MRFWGGNRAAPENPDTTQVFVVWQMVALSVPLLGGTGLAGGLYTCGTPTLGRSTLLSTLCRHISGFRGLGFWRRVREKLFSTAGEGQKAQRVTGLLVLGLSGTNAG